MSDTFKKKSGRPWFGGGIGALVAVVFGFLFWYFPLGKGLTDRSFDLPFVLRAEKTNDTVVIIYLNEESYDVLGQKTTSFDRALHARLLDRMKAEQAKAVVFDILFIDKAPITPADELFAKAIQAQGKVILAAQFDQDEHLLKNSEVVAPRDPFREMAAGWGVAKVHRDVDFAARSHHPGTDRIPSLAWKTAEVLGAEVTKDPASRGRKRWLNFYGPEPFFGVSYAQVMDPTVKLPISFKDKVVFVGSGEVAGYTGEEKEQFKYPWTWLTGHHPFGVEMHAITLANLMRQDWLTRFPWWAESGCLVCFGLLFGFGLTFFRPLPAAGLAVLSAVVVTGLACGLHAFMNVWFPWLIVVAVQIPVVLGWSWLYHSVRSHYETQFLGQALGLYLSPSQVKQMLKNPELLKPGAVQQKVSILFSDIANFSKISERMDPDDLVKLLNQYYDMAIGCVHETGGTVMNLIGDAIFAIWNAPQEQPDHQERACRAALLLQEKLFLFDSSNRSLPLRTRVGLHTGVVCVGNIGSATHFDYVAIGESVNMASRLEGLNKHLGTNLLATRDIQKAVADRLVSRLVGHFKFKGFDQVVEVHELVTTKEKEEGSRAWREAFAEGLHHFQRKAFDAAEKAFRHTLELRPDDGPANFYLARIPDYRVQQLTIEWTGEIDLREK